MKSISILLLIIALCTATYGQYTEDVNFLMLSPDPSDKIIKDRLFIIDDHGSQLKKFFKDNSARTLPAHLKQGELYLETSCQAVFGVCIKVTLGEDGTVSKFSQLDLTMLLKNHVEEDKISLSIPATLDTIITETKKNWPEYWEGALRNEMNTFLRDKNKDEHESLLFINLTEYLVEFYKEQEPNELDCCPEDYNRNLRKEALQKVCHLMSIKKGLTLNLYEGKPHDKAYTYYNSNRTSYFEGYGNDPRGERVPNVDPRRFLVVKEQRRKRQQADTIWNNFSQFRQVIDSRSEVIVQFKLDALKQEIDFEGNISLHAELVSGENTKPIEISPYSVIGSDHTAVGTKSLSPYEFSMRLLTALYKVYELQKRSDYKDLVRRLRVVTDFPDWKNSSVDMGQVLYKEALDYINLKEEQYLKAERNHLLSLTQLDNTLRLFYGDGFTRPEAFSNRSDSIPISDILVWAESGPDDLSTEQRKNLIAYLEDLEKERPKANALKYYSNDDNDRIGNIIQQLYGLANISASERLISDAHGRNTLQITQVKEHLDSVQRKLPTNSLKVLIQTIYYSYLTPLKIAITNSNELQEYVQDFLSADQYTQSALLAAIHKDSLFLSQSNAYMTSVIQQLSKIQTDFEKFMDEISSMDNGSINDVQKYRLSILHHEFIVAMQGFEAIVTEISNLEIREYREASNYYELKRGKVKKGNTSEFLSDWAEYLAINAARYLYKKLIIGKVDLLRENIPDDSQLKLYVLWYTDKGNEPQKLLIGTFVLRKLGWNERISDSFLLINRLNTPGGPDDSPSRFKGAPGVSLQWTYTDDGTGDFVRRLQPSIGINVSYLDFSTQDDVEIGVGVQFGFWKNKVFLGWGTNLNVEDDGGYFSLGFSFANIAEKFNKD
ncbi:MAG: hypothetical protein AAF149_18980 [Bacteroidota bacterium]